MRLSLLRRPKAVRQSGYQPASSARPGTPPREPAGASTAPHRPRRGDDVEAWLKAQRDSHADGFTRDPEWETLDELLDDYRLHADTGTPLSEHACSSNHCECAEVARG